MKDSKVYGKVIPHNENLGIKIHHNSSQSVTLSITPHEQLIGQINSDSLHGGVLISLIDSAAGFAVFNHLNEYTPIATLDLNVNYFQSARYDLELFAEAKCTKRTKALIFVDIVVSQLEVKEPIASATATFMLTSSN